MEDIRLNVDMEVEILIINYLRTPSKSECNDNNFLKILMARQTRKFFPNIMTLT